MGLPARRHQVSRRAAVALLMLGVMLTASTPQAAGRSTAPSQTLLPALATGPPFWLPVAPMRTPRSDLAATLGPDGRIYALGGDNVGDGTLPTAKAYHPVSNVEAYNPVTNAWSADQRLYIVGGGSDDGIYTLPIAEAYDTRSGRRVSLPSMPTDRSDLAAVSAPDGRIYALGGREGEGSVLDVVEAYDPATRHWSAVAHLITRRVGTSPPRGTA